MPDNFFARLKNGAIRRVSMLQAIHGDIRRVFLTAGQNMLEEKEEVTFDGNYKVEDDEILYVNMVLPEGLEEAVNNPMGCELLDLSDDEIRTLFWYEGGTYYFQNFDSRKLLRHRNVIFYSGQTFDTLKEDAFIVDNTVQAVYKEEKFLFLSYANANKIFSLIEFYTAATDEEVEAFCDHETIAVEDNNWFKEHSNTTMRKQIALLKRSGMLDGADTKRICKKAKKFSLDIALDENGGIIFPCDKKSCREILFFLNEQYFVGVISGNPYKTSSKRSVEKKSML